MSTPANASSLWDHGRLARRAPPAPITIGRGHAVGAAALIGAAVVFATYVGVLEGAVHRSESQHAEQRARAVAEAQCESTRPVETRAACRALFDGGVPADTVATSDVAPVNTVYAGAGLSMAAVAGSTQ